MKKCKEKHENTKRKIHNDASPRRTVDNIMTEETCDNVKHMLNSYEDDVNGDHSIIKKVEEDSFGLAEQLKGSIDISYNNSLYQDSVLTTLNLVKSKLEKLKEFQSRNIVTDKIRQENENEVWTNI
jgi:hypothetical protein